MNKPTRAILIDDETDRDEHAAAFLGATARAQTMADGSLRITIDLNPADAVGAFTAFGSPGSPVAVARIKNEVAVEAGRPGSEADQLGKRQKGPYGKFAQKLVQSQFFRSPDIWAGIGNDHDFRTWVTYQKSAVSGEIDYPDDTGVGRNVAAHVRRVDLGSGTAIKPEYSCIPLTNAEHQLAHQNGDSAIGDDDWWRKQRIKYVEKWAYETLKQVMGYDSYTAMPPHRLVEWAEQRELTQYLPLAYINAEAESDQETSEA